MPDAASSQAMSLIGTSPGQLAPNWLFAAVFVLIVMLVGGFLWYLFATQRRFFLACQEQKDLALFATTPAGLPVGTIRSVLALSIVLSGLFLITLTFFAGRPAPEALTAILGTVLGFYFGSRSAAREVDEEAAGRVKELRAERDQAVKDKDSGEAGSLMKKIEKGIALTKTVSAVLPDGMREKYAGVVDKMEQGLDVAKTLATGGNVAGAAAKATEIFDVFKSSNPVRDVVVKASGTFAAVLGNAIPQIAVINAIVTISSTLIGVAYQKWKARILHLPFEPAVIPLNVIDANTGLSVLLQCPIFRGVFAAELDGNDRPFMAGAVKDFLREEDLESLWTKYEQRFESREQFEEGVEEFRRAVADLELKTTIDPALTAPVGGYDALVGAVDKIYADPDARADLDALVEVIDGVKQQGESPKPLFEKVLQEVSS